MGPVALAVMAMVGICAIVAVLYGMSWGLMRMVRLLWRLVNPGQPGAAPRPLPAMGTAASFETRSTALPPCWETKDCSAEARSHCPAYGKRDVPCWLAHLQAAGKLKSECLTCPHFSLVGLMERT